MLCFSLSKNCTKDASAHTLRLPTEALPRPLRARSYNKRVSGFGYRLRSNPSLSLRTSDTRQTLYAITEEGLMRKHNKIRFVREMDTKVDQKNMSERRLKLTPEFIGIRLGREYTLSAAEIFSLIEANELGLQFYDVTENILILNSTNQRKDYLEYLSQCGGAIKIFELPFIYRGVGQKGYKEARDKLYSWLKNINLINDYLKDVLYEKQKFVFGVSSYALSDFKGNIDDLRKYNEFFGMFLKNELKQYKLKSGFMGVVIERNPPELTSVEITKKKLLERSFELVTCIGKDEILVGKTLWVQNYQREF